MDECTISHNITHTGAHIHRTDMYRGGKKESRNNNNTPEKHRQRGKPRNQRLPGPTHLLMQFFVIFALFFLLFFSLPFSGERRTRRKPEEMNGKRSSLSVSARRVFTLLLLLFASHNSHESILITLSPYVSLLVSDL